MTSPRELLVLLFHSVDDRDLLSLRDLGNIRPEVFEGALIALKEEFDIVSLEDMVGFITGHTEAPRRPLAITFDDGGRSYASNAVPIMKSHGVPSKCFLITDCMDERAIYWRYLYNYCVHAGWGKELGGLIKEEYGVPEAKGGIIRFTRNNFSREKTGRIVEGILAKIVSQEEYRGREGRLFLSFDDLKDLKEDPLVSFGIHTRSHPVMTGLTDEEIRDEISGSLEFYQEWIDGGLPMFSVPFGRLYQDYDERTVRTAAGLSIKHIFSAYGGANRKGQPLYNIRRVPVNSGMLEGGTLSFIGRLRSRSAADDYLEAEARLSLAAEGKSWQRDL